MHLLQVCNVGHIVGGTAACAWSLARALPDWSHTIAFLSAIDSTTCKAFHPHTVVEVSRATPSAIETVSADLTILHNIAPDRIRLPTGSLTLQYIHSAGRRMAADQTVYCSEWLALQFRQTTKSVLWQGVPVPLPPQRPRPRHSGQLRVGRICTPTRCKWPDALVRFYEELAAQHPLVQWDFVGCPENLRPLLEQACQNRATFLPASWEARSHLWEWDVMLYHHPTLTESFGRTLAEAARAGCIPVVDRRGGFEEQLRRIGGFGCRTIQEFSEALTSLSDRAIRVPLAEGIQQRADESFSLRAFRERFESLRRRITDLRVGTEM